VVLRKTDLKTGTTLGVGPGPGKKKDETKQLDGCTEGKPRKGKRKRTGKGSGSTFRKNLSLYGAEYEDAGG